MKLNKKTQLGIMLALYLSRNGRSSCKTVAKRLNLPPVFLDQVAQLLRKGGVIKSTKGPGGGYEILGDPCISDVYTALESSPLLEIAEITALSRGEKEHRSLVYLALDINCALGNVMHRKIRSLVNGLNVVDSKSTSTPVYQNAISSKVN